jgi:Heterokaryon incompatibility protein (HET)
MREREQQVSLMGEIYRRYSKVYCWLDCPMVDLVIAPTKKDEKDYRNVIVKDRYHICSCIIGSSFEKTRPPDPEYQETSTATSRFHIIQFAKQLKQRLPDKWDYASPAQKQMSIAAIITSDLHLIAKRLKQHFRLSRAPWWTRIWTLQELFCFLMSFYVRLTRSSLRNGSNNYSASEPRTY